MAHAPSPPLPSHPSVETGAGTTSFAYDYEGRVTSITYPSTSSDTFGYNGLGARSSTSGTNGSRTFLRNGLGVTSPVLEDGNADYTPGVSRRASSSTTFAHAGLKNETEQSSSSQTVTATKQYDAFGNLASSNGSWQGAFGYGGDYGYQEDASGLKLLGHRYYDSSTGRFLTSDPAGSGRNWYSYANNNPVSRIDPSGLEWHHPSQVHVSPNFKGKVFVVGEPHKGYDIDGDGKEDQIMMQVPPGHSSPRGMDVDYVIIVYPDGCKEFYFLMGTGKVDGRAREYNVNELGWVAGANVWGFVSGYDFHGEIAKAKMNSIPTGLGPEPMPCYLPGFGPFGIEASPEWKKWRDAPRPPFIHDPWWH